MNHTYWNISGDFDEKTVAKHALRLPNSFKYLATNNSLIPTGELKPIEGTQLDFIEFTDLKEVLDKNIEGGSFKGLDHAFTIKD